MLDYDFYKTEYCGDSISAEGFPRLARRAGAQLEKYKRELRVSGDKHDENMAVCAMADAMYFFETMENGGITISASVGSVSSSNNGATIDISSSAQAVELYKCARQYLNIYRGCR